MDAIQTAFSKNARWRNVLFIVSFSLGVLLVITWAFLGTRYLYSAPLITAMMLTAIALRPPKYYYPFCVGALLSYGLFQSLMAYLTVGLGTPVFICLAIGIVGYGLLVLGVSQAVLGSLSIIGIKEKILNIILAVGFIFFVVQLVVVEIHGIKTEEPPKYKTY